MPSDEGLIARHADAMRAHGYAARTIEKDLGHLRRLFCFLAARKVEILRVVPATLEEYRIELARTVTSKKRPLRPSSFNNCLVAVKTFYRMLHDADVMAYNPARKLTLVSVPPPLPPPVLTVDEMSKLLDSIDPSTPIGARDRALFELLYSSGLRVAEAAGLAVNDVDLCERLCRVRQGKGGKDRVVPVGPTAARHIDNYLGWVRPTLGGHLSTWLWLRANGRAGKPLETYSVRRQLTVYARAAGIERRLTPHGFRHACAAHMLENGAELRHLQELLGHASVKSTQVYTHLSVGHLRQTLARCHPRERGTLDE